MPLAVSRRHPRWLAIYYYASGVQKDASIMSLEMLDAARASAAAGAAEPPAGASISMHGDGTDNIGPFRLEGDGDTVWGGNLAITFHFKKTYTNRGGREPPAGHVSHVGYWSEEGPTGTGLGLWGVWEVVTSAPHFELQKGGVFRLVPLTAADFKLFYFRKGTYS